MRALVGLALLGVAGCNALLGIPDTTQGNFDECAAGVARCDANATCTDTPDAYTCACKPGWKGDGFSCVDVDECATANPCDPHAACTNSTGSYSCACNAGYTGDGASCVPQFTKLAVGASFTCGIAVDSTLWCWGANNSGQLADGTTEPHARPRQVGTRADWTDVDGKFGYACGSHTDHSLSCWGNNDKGQIGDGSQGDVKLSPTPVMSTMGFKAFSTGQFGVCAIRDDGSMVCWGFVQPGNHYYPMPTQVGTDIDWTQISTGFSNYCGIRSTTGGNLYCWGNAGRGELGVMASTATPTRINTDTWLNARLFLDHGCGVRTDGALLCWGKSSYGALGTGVDVAGPIAPTQIGSDMDWASAYAGVDVSGAVKSNGVAYFWGDDTLGGLGSAQIGILNQPTAMSGTWDSITLGWDHSCALHGGHASCWGYPGLGALGDGTMGARTVPTRVNSASWISVATSMSATCGVRIDGTLFCWGYNFPYGVGLGDALPAPFPARVTATNNSWSSPSINFTICALQNGLRACWGDNSYGSVGNGSSGAAVLTAASVAGTVWSEISTGWTHTCAIKQSDSSLWCWGNDDYAALGDGGGTSTTGPTTALAGAWLHVSAGYNHTCGVKTDHTVWCWGDNSTGQLGDNTKIMKTTPTQEATLATDWAQVSMEAWSTCGVKTGGQLYCWGNSAGDGTTMDRPLPQPVGTDTDWKQVSPGDLVTCAVKTGGTLWCWGDNGFYELADGTTQAKYDPRQVGTDSDWSMVSTGTNYGVCAIKSDKSLWCWGDNTYAQLGLGSPWVTTPVQIN
jgi:alpha-tubulin suppressor-like RCC1 family protein